MAAATGFVEPRVRFHLGGRRLFDLDVRPAAATAVTPYPNLLALPPWRTEELLRERLARLGGKVEFGTEVTGLDGETVTLGTGETVRARFVVGADGGRSTIRHALGIAFTGHSGPQSAVVADVRLDGLDTKNGVHLGLEPREGMMAARPIHGPICGRWSRPASRVTGWRRRSRAAA